MKICFISKYPPIEGGVSSYTYWLCKALGERGHKIHIVTNAWEVEDDYREIIDDEDIEYYQPKNVFVHNTDPFTIPKFIPISKCYGERIASLAIELIKNEDLDLIDSWYILPYGISGYIAKIFTSKKQILRHAGSDLTRIFHNPQFHSLFLEILRNVEKIGTNNLMKRKLSALKIDKKKFFINERNVNTATFSPNIKKTDISCYGKIHEPILTYIGKSGRYKGIYLLLNALKRIKENYSLLILTDISEMHKLKTYTKNFGIRKKVIFIPFLPPWRIPGIMRSSTVFFQLERGFPVLGHRSMVVREAMATGICPIISKEVQRKVGLKIKNNFNAIVVEPNNTVELRDKIKKIIKKPEDAYEIGRNAYELIKKYENFEEYVRANEKVYEELLTY
ncbi:MAG: glycosyltransferase family 4 protein [Candidatus Thermoplasmatota archaeon]